MVEGNCLVVEVFNDGRVDRALFNFLLTVRVFGMTSGFVIFDWRILMNR